jgi:hypothetical protein
MTFDQFLHLLEAMKWPGVVLALALLVIFLFRAQLAVFLSRVTSIGKEGLKTGPVTGQQTQPDRTKQAQELMRALDSAALVEQERVIKADLEKRGLEHTGETVDVLVRYLAQSQLAVAFEEVYRVIFGSQIYILKRANENRVLNRTVIEGHFRHTQTLFPEFADWDVDRYMSFLLTRGLLQRTGDDYLITTLGTEFLGWMVRIGAGEYKPL